MVDIDKRFGPVLMLCVACCTGCATSGPSVLKVAGAVEALRSNASTFTQNRREIVRLRREVLSQSEEEAARLAGRGDTAVGIWRIAGLKDAEALYNNVLTATREAANQEEALVKQRKAHEEALARADTRVRFDLKKLADATNALTSLGSADQLNQGDLMKQVTLYFSYARTTIDEIRNLQAEADKKDQDAKAAAETTRNAMKNAIDAAPEEPRQPVP